MGCKSSKQQVIVNDVVKLNTAHNKEELLSRPEDLKINTAVVRTRKTTSIQQDYTIGPKIGSGSFGNVRRVIHKPTGQIRAVKTIKKSNITSEMREDSKFFKEVDILRQADHPNILQIYEFYEDSTSFHLVTELLNGGELFDYIINRKFLSEPIAAHFFRQMINAVAYCHSNGIVHRDIKPENLLLDSDSSNATLKIIDFGTSTLADSDEMLHTKLGTPYYIAPEVLKRKYDSKCDIWSCGVILYILLTGVPPFMGKTNEEILANVEKGKYSMKGPQWRHISSEAKDLIIRMLDMTPGNRPSAQEILSDNWLSIIPPPDFSVQAVKESYNSLKKFRADTKLQEAVMAFIGVQLIAKEDSKTLTKMFTALDTNSDGKLSKEELINGYMKHMGAAEAEEEVEKILSAVDTDGNGYIEYSEFVVASLNREVLLSKTNLERAFEMFDSDGSGSISASELRQVLGSDFISSDAVWNELVNTVDQNGDGQIDIKEFKEMMLKLF